MGRIIRLLTLKNAFRLLAGVVALLLLLAAGVIVEKKWWDAHAFERYNAAPPLEAKVLATGPLGGGNAESVEIAGVVPGEQIPLRIILPSTPGPHPCVVFNYGIGQRLTFFDQIAPLFAAQGVAMVMAEQYDCGVRRDRSLNALGKVRAQRERAARVIAETRRVVDYLVTRDDVDATRIDFMGASYGGITGCAVLAKEPRLRTGTLVMAGGDVPKMVVSLIRTQKPDSRFLWPMAGRVAAWWLSAFEPLDFVGEIAPRPLLFLHVRDDEMIASECIESLYRAAGTPKEEIWYQGPHNKIGKETVQAMMSDSMAWMRRYDGHLPAAGMAKK